VKPGDVLTVALDHSVRVLKVRAFAERRGGVEQGRALYEDLSPAPAAEAVAPRELGAGRPTKRERRALDRFTGEDGA